MKLEQQVVSLELAQKLKELGVKQESLFYWYEENEYKEEVDAFLGTGKWKVITNNASSKDTVSAFTVAELDSWLPKGTTVTKYRDFENSKDFYEVSCPTNYHEGELTHSDKADENGADARAKMLVYLLENKLVTL